MTGLKDIDRLLFNNEEITNIMSIQGDIFVMAICYKIILQGQRFLR